MKHCDEFIDRVTPLGRFLRVARWPAHYRVRLRRMFKTWGPTLFATHCGKRVPVEELSGFYTTEVKQ